METEENARSIHDQTSQAIRYSIVDKVLDVPFVSTDYQGFFMGAYKTCFSTWVAEHALIYSCPVDELRHQEAPLVRINSACFTGDILGDRRCDCTEQLHMAMNIMKSEPGLVIYHMHHEGRGLGLTSKLHSYKKMNEEGISTFEAHKQLTNRNDLRSYGSAILILHDLGITNLRLMTNNPNKKFILEANGIAVASVVGAAVDRPDIRQYLRSKRDEQAHFIDFDLIEKS